MCMFCEFCTPLNLSSFYLFSLHLYLLPQKRISLVVTKSCIWIVSHLQIVFGLDRIPFANFSGCHQVVFGLVPICNGSQLIPVCKLCLDRIPFANFSGCHQVVFGLVPICNASQLIPVWKFAKAGFNFSSVHLLSPLTHYAFKFNTSWIDFIWHFDKGAALHFFISNMLITCGFTFDPSTATDIIWFVLCDARSL